MAIIKKKSKNPIYELYNNLTKYLMQPSDELLKKLYFSINYANPSFFLKKWNNIINILFCEEIFTYILWEIHFPEIDFL